MDPLTQRLMMGSGQLKTLIFNTAGTYTWTAPSNTNNVLRLTGRGGSGNTVIEFQGIDGSQVNESSFRMIGYFNVDSPNPEYYATTLGASLTYENMRSRINSTLLPSWQSITTDPAGAFYSTLPAEPYNYETSRGVWNRRIEVAQFGRYRRVGTVSAVGEGSFFGNPDIMSGTGTIPITRPLPDSPISTLGAYASNVEVQVMYNNTGGNSTALGFTFAGTATTNPTETTQTNVAVTPGATYTIVVGNNFVTPTSFIKLEYY